MSAFDYDRIALVLDEERPGGEYGAIWPGTVVTANLSEVRGLHSEAQYQVYAEDDRLFNAWRDAQGFDELPAGVWDEDQEVAEDSWWADRDADLDERIRTATREALASMWVTELQCGCSKGRSGHLHWMDRDEGGNASCSKGYGSVIGWRVWTVDELVAAVVAGEFDEQPQPVAAGG